MQLVRTLSIVFLLLFAAEVSAQWSQVGSGTHVDASSGTSLTPTEPTGCAEDDLVVAFGKWRDTSSALTITDPTDFIEIDQLYETTGSADDVLYVGYKIRGSTAGDGYQFDISSSESGQMNLLCFRPPDTATPVDVTYVRASHYDADNNGPNVAAEPITTNTDGALVLLLWMGTQGLSSTSGGPPSGYTEAHEFDMTAAIDGAYAAYKEVSTAGLETPGVFTHTDVDNVDDPRKFTLAFRQASSGSSIPLRRIAEEAKK